MKKTKSLILACLMAFLLGLIPGGAVWADDGGDDGGFDDGGFDDGGDDQDEEDDEEHHDGHGHHWSGHHHHHHGGYWGIGPGFGFGPPFGFGAFGYMPPFYPSPYYAYPARVVQPSPPPVYIQQQNAAQPSAGPQTNYWHYCQASEGYYPEVKECPNGWQQVAPQPPPPQPPQPESQDSQG
ncbi:MAG: hypothetical protein M3Q16_06720 [Pseudomonadota bacterium]|nr:hypothetical protein [Pseudomonadota bacterium]